MKVCTQNLAACAKSWQRKSFSSRLPHIKAGVGYYNPDVLCVQETGSGSYLRRIDAELKALGYARAPRGGRWRHIYYKPTRVQLHDSGLMTLNRLGTKHAAWAKFTDRKSGQIVFVTSVHLSAGGEGFAQARFSQAETLLRKSIKLNPKNHPAIHAGDFNSVKLVGDVVMAPNALVDARKVTSKAQHLGYDTFNGRDTVKMSRRDQRINGQHLDHVYVAEQLRHHVYYWSQRDSRAASDHNLVCVKVAL